MDDVQLLELAAKAAGLTFDPSSSDSQGLAIIEGARCYGWNPLIHDADAFRLAVRLGLSVIQQRPLSGLDPIAAAAGFGGEDYRLTSVPYQDDPLAATRRSIVLAAMMIGSRPG